MKKILIVNNNMDMGGIQKSLANFLNALHGSYDLTLLLFSKSGSLLDEIPEDVKVIVPRRCYRVMGLTRQELRAYPDLFLLKGLLKQWCRIFSRRSAMRILGLFQKKISGYDCVISFSHLTGEKNFMYGCGDFVLDKTISGCKICLFHCDYLHAFEWGSDRQEFAEFDRIACCSESVRVRFLEGSHLPGTQVVTLRNFYDFGVKQLAKTDPFPYDPRFVNLISVARLSPEKGIDRAVQAISDSRRTDLRYYIVGDGPQRSALERKIKELHLQDRVYLLGEQSNPYRYMLHADYLLVPSLHEAAPMVYDEANMIGLRILSTETTSAREMISQGRICENTVEDMTGMLCAVTKSEDDCGCGGCIRDNRLQEQQFAELLGRN